MDAYGGTDAAGIGGGEGGNGGIVNITGGYVFAQGNDLGAGIGGGQDGNGADVTITGGVVIATAGANAPSAIGKGSGSGDSHNNLTFADNSCVFITENLYRSQKENRVSDCRNNQYVRVTECAHGGATATIVDGSKHGISSCQWCYTTSQEAHTFGDYGQCSVCGLIGLADNADNNGLIVHWHGTTEKSVTLSGRTLYKDGDWNTLCLPFNLASLTGTPLAGATVKELDTKGTYDTDKKTGYDATSGTLYLYFKTADAIEVGKPYIVKWETTGDPIENPVFSGVTVESDLNDVDFQGGAFKGNYSYMEWAAGTAYLSILLLGGSNALFWPDGTDATILGACRAYFELTGGASAREFVLNFGDETTTGVALIDNGKWIMDNEAGAWYTLDGRMLDTKPTQKGVYIHNGVKRVIK